MDDAVGKQGRLISEHLQRSEDAAAALSDRTQSIERGVSGLASGIEGLKPLPVTIFCALQRSGPRAIDGRATRQPRGRLAADDDKLQAIQRSLDTLVTRPAAVCPACVCDPPRAVAAEGITHAKATVAPPLAAAPTAHAAAVSESPAPAMPAERQAPSSSTH